MSLPFSEWSREAKDEFAQKRMEEMKLKNEALKQRYAEVEQDRIKAEAKDSAVKISKKENTAIEKEEDNLKVEREWDKEKLDQDAEDWNPPKFFGYRSRTQRRNFPDRSSPKKENWRVRSTNVGKDRQSYSKFKSSGPNLKYQETSNYGTSGFRNESANFSRQRDRAHRTSSGAYRSFQNSRFDEPRKKQASGGAVSASPSLSDSELEPVKIAEGKEDRMWPCLGISEAQHKKSRVEKWVKAINTASSWNDEYDNIKRNDYEKRSEGVPRDTVKSYGYGNEERYPKKTQSTRDQTHLRNRERYDGSKYGQPSRGNSRARGSRTPTGERTAGGFEDKSQRDFRKRNYSDKNKVRRESDYSDRTSSMKERDYHSCNKDKFNRTISDSKSSDYSGIGEDVVCDVNYDSEKKLFDKQSNTRNYGKDKFYKSKNVQFPTVSCSQDAREKDDFDDEYVRNTRQKLPNNYVKDQSKTKNLRNTDHSGFDDQHVDSRANTHKIKYNKYKAESKFVGHSGKFENESAVDNQAGCKYKINKPSPKRIPSSHVKSEEFNPETDGLWEDYEQDTVWNIDNNDGQAEHKSSLVEDETDVNEVSQTLDWSTPVETDSDQARANPKYEMNETSPKSSPVKSIDPSSSTSKTMEINPNFDDVESNIVQDIAGNIERNDGQTESKSSLVEDEADVNEDSQPLDWSTPVKTDCDTSSEKLLYQNSEVNGVAVPELHDTNVKDAAESMCRNQNRQIEKQDAVADYNAMTNDTHDDSSENVEYFGDQNEEHIIIQELVSDTIKTIIDSYEGNSSSKFVTNESEPSLQGVSIPEVQNSQYKIVQSTEVELTDSILSNNANLDLSDLEVAQEKISVKDAFSNDTDCETPTKQAVEMDKAETVHSEIKVLSSQSVNAAYTDSESMLESSDLVTAEPQFPKCQGNDTEINSGALNLSDDGGWSTVSEDENNVSDDDKNNKEGSSTKKSEN